MAQGDKKCAGLSMLRLQAFLVRIIPSVYAFGRQETTKRKGKTKILRTIS